jgi:photosystem II stability/assembly factor-like uncharacterized protein
MPTDEQFHDVDMLSAEEGWAVSTRSVYHYSNGSWTEVELPAFGPSLRSVDVVSADTAWAVGQDEMHGVILRYRNGEWARTAGPSSGTLRAVDFAGPDDGWAAGSSGMLRYRDGSWGELDESAPKDVAAIHLVSADDGWAVGGHGNIFRYDGEAWRTYTSPTTDSMTDIEMVTSEEGWAVGFNGTVLHYSDGTWNEVAVRWEPDTRIRAIDMVRADEGWAVGFRILSPGYAVGTILHYRAGVWTQGPSPADEPLWDLDMLTAGEGWSVGHEPDCLFHVPCSGVILHYRDGTWEIAARPESEPLAVHMLSPYRGWAVGYGLIRYQSAEWVDEPASPVSHGVLTGIDIVSANEGWAVGQYGTILHYHPYRIHLPYAIGSG